MELVSSNVTCGDSFIFKFFRDKKGLVKLLRREYLNLEFLEKKRLGLEEGRTQTTNLNQIKNFY